MLRWRRVEVSGGFLLLAAVLYYLDADGMLFWVLAACALHELGHLGMIYLMGGRVSLLRLTCVGAELRLAAFAPLSVGGEVLAALAGPMANLITAIGAARMAGILGETAYFFAGINLALCAFNLLPMAQLDGGRLCRRVLEIVCPAEMAGWILRLISIGIGVALVTGGVLLLWESGSNMTLLLTAGWLLYALMRENREKMFYYKN